MESDAVAGCGPETDIIGYSNLSSVCSEKGIINMQILKKTWNSLQSVFGQKVIRAEKSRDVFSSSEMPAPRHLLVAVTFDCKAACPHCYLLQQNRRTFGEKIHMNEDLYRRILGSSHAKTATKITLTGGEPMLQPEFFKWVELADAAGIPHIASITNGWSLQDDEKVNKLIDVTKLSYFNISMDAHTQEGFCRAKGIKDCNFDLICRNVKRLTDRFRGTRTRISGSFVITTLNKDKVREIIQFGENLGFHKITLHALHLAQGRSHGSQEVTQNKDCDAIIRKTDYTVDVTVKLPFPLCYGTYYCSSLATFLCVGANRILAPCCHVPWDNRYGEYSKDEVNPMNHPAIVEMRKAFMSAAEREDDTLLPAVCRACPKRSRGHLYFDSKARRWNQE
jgi:MoaA/NifB/PqqE/SkfB family radical SAM enzyme